MALSNLGFIVAHGDDAASFLHGQMSQDMTNQPSNQARLAAYCSAKGRMLASMVVVVNFVVDLLYAVIDPRVKASDI